MVRDDIFQQVLWQFLLPEKKRQFQVFLWRQILSIRKVTKFNYSPKTLSAIDSIFLLRFAISKAKITFCTFEGKIVLISFE